MLGLLLDFYQRHPCKICEVIYRFLAWKSNRKFHVRYQ
jgi:hypothetical protein